MLFIYQSWKQYTSPFYLGATEIENVTFIYTVTQVILKKRRHFNKHNHAKHEIIDYSYVFQDKS